jgi:hypothetical protein
MFIRILGTGFIDVCVLQVVLTELFGAIIYHQ